MEIGISTASLFTRYDTECALEPIAQLGATRYEAFLGGKSEYQPAFAQDLKRRQEALGLRCTSVHALGSQFEPQLFSGAQRQRDDAQDVFKSVLEAAATVGAMSYVMHGVFFLKQGARNPNVERNALRLVELSRMAKSFGVRLTLENVHWCMYAHSGYAAQLAPYLDDCDLGYTLDIKQAAQSGDALLGYAQEMGDRLCNVHLCDVRATDTGWRTCLPGQGEADFEALLRHVSAHHPAANVTLEVYAHDYDDLEELARSYRWLQALDKQTSTVGD